MLFRNASLPYIKRGGCHSVTGKNMKQKYELSNQQYKRKHFNLWMLAPYLLILLLIGCENRPETNAEYGVSAVWNTETATLNLSGNTSPSETSVQIHDAADGSLLGMALVNSDGSWTANATTAACEVHVALPEGTTTFAVQNTPEDCTGSASYSRAALENGKVTSAADIPNNVLVVDNPSLLNTVPNAVILDPPQNLTINAGQIVNFQGVAIGTGVAPPFSYFWNFGGAAPNAAIQNPGSIRFDVPGTYFIQLSVSDNLGIPDPTPAIRTITVNGTNSPIGLAPTPSIIAPAAVNGTVNINLGETVFFAGAATDSLGSTSFTYEWNFSGIYPNQFGATAGAIPFTRAGTYLVSLYATSVQGLRSPIPATVSVVVGTASGVNQAPTGAITRPRNDVTIDAGESLRFKARGQDPDNTLPLLYSWDFQGVAPNINMSTDESAGSVTFNTPGVYYIRMTVTDSLGSADPNPPVRIVTVQSTPTTPPPNGVLTTQITSPPSDLSILPGQSVFFSGQILSSTNNVGPVQYFWDFGGAAVSSNLQTPGSITFPIPGQYFVTFFALDAVGNMVGTTTSRTITVTDPSNVGANIISPLDRSNVVVGEPMNMIGQVDNSTGFTILDYKWSIKLRGSNRSIFTSTLLSPGNYIFTQPGDYVIRFQVSGVDAFGNPTVKSKVKSRVTVTNPIPSNPNPAVNNAGIMLPASDMVVYIGSSVDFEANTVTGASVNYNWDFGGLRSPSSVRNPRPITVNSTGTFFVTLRITGSVNGAIFDLYDQRVITVLQQNPSFPPTPVPGVNGTGIQSPVSNEVINVGNSVRFIANSVAGTNLNYNWDFGGARSPSTSRSPGDVRFNSPGTFFVTLLVTGIGSNGFPINNFDQRTITVLQSNIPPTNPAPLGTGIIQPASDTIINAGRFVNFEATNIIGADLDYNWNFDTVRSPSTRRNPSPVQFNFPGSYLVSVQISGNLNGSPLNMYDHRVVTVLQSGSSPFPNPNPPVPPISGVSMPEGFISQPAQSTVTVSVGQPIQFMGNGFDPQGIGALTFQWSFGGARRNISTQNPGSVTFNRAGTYVVTLLVKNAIGQFDSTPPTVVVSVTP